MSGMVAVQGPGPSIDAHTLPCSAALVIPMGHITALALHIHWKKSFSAAGCAG
jgi:hypothetical protein